MKQRMHELTGLSDVLLEAELTDFSDRKVVSNAKGTYLIYSDEHLIYAGQSSRLKDRLFGAHLRGHIDDSHFRKSLFKYLHAKSEQEISDFVRTKCKF
jgi:hypothetical protein